MTLHDAARASLPADHQEGPRRPPLRSGFSIKAAMIVPGIGLLILILFIGAGFLTSNPVQKTKTSTQAFSVPGSPLRAMAAVRALKVITASGQPPGNIINAVAIPVGATRVSFENSSAADQGYSAQITLQANDSQAALETFYAKVLKKQGWQILSTGAAPNLAGGLEVLGKKAGADGFYWDIGAVISPTSFGAGAPAAGRTSFALKLYQEQDPD
jgi:hypothetical protein